jgi:BT1 family
MESFEDELDDRIRRVGIEYPLELEGETLIASSASSLSVHVPTKSDYPVNSWLSRGFYEWLFPPNVPRECQLLRRENICIPACYLMVGLLQGLSGPLINVYPIDLGATEAQQTTVSTIRSLPASFKLLFGFMSDNLPIRGYRRKSYMLIGWMIASTSLLALLFFTDLSMSQHDGPPPNAPTIPALSLSLLGFGTGFWLADVMGDSIVAEKAKLELVKGHIQSTCYACRFFGLMMAAPLSTILYSTVGPAYVIGLLTLLPLTVLPSIYWLREEKNIQVKSTADQCQEIYKTVCSRAVWQPMGFVYLYNLLQVGNSAWKEYLKTVLGFTSSQLNIILIVAYVLLYLGVLAYKYCFIHWSWRSVYIFTTLINGFFSALQVLLIQGITFGMSNFVFALGDDAFSEFLGGIQFLPTTIMMVHLCPTGSEGASYAMFTTVSNSAMTLSSAVSTHLLGIWDVSREALAKGELQGLTNLTVLTTALQVSGILFVGWLPRTKEDLVKLHHASSVSKIGGFIFLSITFLSIIYSMTVGVLNILMPGWSGES